MWQEKDDQLYRRFKFKDFKEAFAFMTAVAAVAEKQAHHPRWENVYNQVDIWLQTHDSKTITNKDQKLAKSIDQLYSQTSKADKLDSLKLYADGGARGNPGPAATAYVICDLDDNVVEKSGAFIGQTTNNQAEYRALQAGLDRVGQLGIENVEVFMDSELVVKQINGQYKVKNNDLRSIFAKIMNLTGQFKSIKFIHVPRAMNKIADAEVNRILDQQAAKTRR